MTNIFTGNDPEPATQPIAEMSISIRLEADYQLSIKCTRTKDAIRADDQDFTTIKVEATATRLDGTLDKIDKLKANFKVTGGKVSRTTDVEIDAKSNWAEKDGEIAVEINAEATLADTKIVLKTEAAINVKIKIIGASPELTFEASPESADADGTSIVTITPKLTLFGSEYKQRLIINEEDLTFSDAYFRRLAESPPESASSSLGLRCKFRLNDKPFDKVGKRTTRVTLKKVCFAEREYGEHYPNGLPAKAEDRIKEIDLKPSRIECDPPSPNLLPRSSEDRHRWKSRLSAKVLSASNRPLPGDVILRDSSVSGLTGANCDGAESFEFFDWYFKLNYKPPAQPWLKILDSQGGSCQMRISKVDQQGQIHFKNPELGSDAPYHDYDHWIEFFDRSKMHIKGQGCTVETLFDADGELFPGGSITIGVVEEKSQSVQFSVIAQSKQKLRGAIVIVKDRDGTERSGETDSSGKTLVTGIPPDRGPYVVTAYKHAELKGGLIGNKAESDPLSFEIKEDGHVFELTLPCSTEWKLSTNTAAALPAGAATGVGLVVATLTNRTNKRERTIVFAGSGFARGSKLRLPNNELGAGLLGRYLDQVADVLDALPNWLPSKGISTPYDPFPSSWSEFDTETPVMFEDFNGLGWYAAVEVSLGVGYAPAVGGILAVYPSAIWLGSVSLGAPGATAQIFVGKWSFARTKN